jgi:hypothetical protein
MFTLICLAVPYRACKRLKNVKNSDGKVTKTICATETIMSHITNRRHCESFNMKMVGFDSHKLEPEVYELANQYYDFAILAFIFVAGQLNGDLCRCISNANSGYSDDKCSCIVWLNAFCEFKYPRGEMRDGRDLFI